MGGVSVNSLCQQDELFALSVNRHSGQKYITEREIFRRTPQEILDVKQIIGQTGNYKYLIVFLRETELINRV